jgi:carboxyl-terminal processing protease
LIKKIILLALIPLLSFSQLDKSSCKTLHSISAIIQQAHYRSKPIDDSLSVFVFKKFLNDLNTDNRLFLESEITELKKHQYSIDNYIVHENCDFLNDFYNLYLKAVTRHSAIIESIKSEPFSFSSEEKIEFSKKTFPPQKEEQDIKSSYKRKILFDVLKDMAEVSQNKDSILANFETISMASKAKVFDSYSCRSSQLALTKAEFLGKFYNAFCTYFDPHTEYFSKNERSNFLSSVSADNLTFGLFLSLSENNEITVDEIMPESSAYNTKIDKGDKIIKIKCKGEELLVSCGSMNKIGDIIGSSTFKNADFTFRKKSGEIFSVKLAKKILKNYENTIYSYVIKQDEKNIGYIKIPSFYAKFDNGKSNVSDDLIHEIAKLQQDHIEGLIIDLENNGGGSMEEAVKMISLFIDKGPIAVMNNQFNENLIIDDPYVGLVYSDPVAILINGFSASASEFFTNAMQDYKRAVILGNQSYGKATIQRIFPLKNNRNPDEFIKLTIEKFYRITGKSNQKSGITPDIIIPTLFDKQMPRESEYETAFKNDSIEINSNYEKVNSINYEQAISNSQKRITDDKNAKKINDLNAEINQLYDDLQPITLKFDDVFNQVTKVNKVWKEVEKIAEEAHEIDLFQNTTDRELQKNDSYLKTINTENIKSIKSNIHIIEAAAMMKDLTATKN